jgi:hypothetical protein
MKNFMVHCPMAEDRMERERERENERESLCICRPAIISPFVRVEPSRPQCLPLCSTSQQCYVGNSVSDTFKPEQTAWSCERARFLQEEDCCVPALKSPARAGVQCKLVKPLWKTIWQLLKKTKHRPAIWSSNTIPPRGIAKGMRLRLLQRHLHTHVYCGTIHSSQAMETAKMPHHWRMD